MRYLFCAPMGAFVIDEGRIVFEAPITRERYVEVGRALREGQWIPEEERALLKHPEAAIVAFKKEPKGHKFATDAHALQIVRKALEERRYEFKDAATMLTKRLVKGSLRTDDIVMQLVRAMRENEKAVNLMVRRVREWYELHNPEVSRKIDDHAQFIDAILIKSREALLAEMNLTEDESMGARPEPHDWQALLDMARSAQSLYKLRDEHRARLETIMQQYYPNVSAVASPSIGAELLALAGSLEKLACMASSTVQLLGAEKALFKHLKNRSVRPPKHGVIVNHPLMATFEPKRRGKLARTLADKISVAARLDYFKGEFLGEKLLEQVKEAMR